MASRRSERRALAAQKATEQVNDLLFKKAPDAVRHTTGGDLAWDETIRWVRHSPPDFDLNRTNHVAVVVSSSLRNRLHRVFLAEPQSLKPWRATQFANDLLSLQRTFSQRAVMRELYGDDALKLPDRPDKMTIWAFDRTIDDYFDREHFPDFVEALELEPWQRDAVLSIGPPTTGPLETFPHFAEPFVQRLAEQAGRSPGEVLTDIRRSHREWRPAAVASLVVGATYRVEPWKVNCTSEVWKRVHDTLGDRIAGLRSLPTMQAVNVHAAVDACFEAARPSQTEPETVHDSAAAREQQAATAAHAAGTPPLRPGAIVPPDPGQSPPDMSGRQRPHRDSAPHLG